MSCISRTIIFCIAALSGWPCFAAADGNSAPAATDISTPTTAATAAEASAGDTGTPAAEEKPLWEMNLAAFGRLGPAYPGSEESQVNIVPLPFPIYRGSFLRVGDETGKPVRTRIFRRDRIKLDIDFGLNFPVDSEDVDVRTGMPDLGLLAEAGPELELEFVRGPKIGNAFLALQLRGAVSFDGIDPTWQGLIFSTEFKYRRKIRSERAEILARITPEWAGGDYMDFFYTVAPEFATQQRPAYESSGGYLGTKAAITFKYDFTEKFAVRTGVRAGFYQGARNRRSPLFTSDTTGEIYLAFLWKFWESKTMVPAEL